MRSRGEALDEKNTGAPVGLRVGHNFSEALARAWTMARHPAFARQYAPATDGARELLASELAHVLEQPRALPPGSLAVSGRHGRAEYQAGQAVPTPTSSAGRSWQRPISVQSAATGLQRCPGVACPPAGCDHRAEPGGRSGSSGGGGLAGRDPHRCLTSARVG